MLANATLSLDFLTLVIDVWRTRGPIVGKRTFATCLAMFFSLDPSPQM
jgi:hypothetical protein